MHHTHIPSDAPFLIFSLYFSLLLLLFRSLLSPFNFLVPLSFLTPVLLCAYIQSGLSGLSELGTPRGGSVRIQHRPPKHPSGSSIAAATSGSASAVETSRFPKLDECAHFHYDVVDLGPLTVCHSTLFRGPVVNLCCFDAPNTGYQLKKELEEKKQEKEKERERERGTRRAVKGEGAAEI